MTKISTCLWFDEQAEEAARFYMSIFKNSKILGIRKYTAETPSDKPVGSVMTVTFELDGQKFMTLNGGQMFKFNEAISLMINCKDQAEIDHYWNKLSEGGDEKAQVCGWLKDKYGLSWQIVPEELDELMKGQKAKKVMEALLQMKKLDIQKLREAGK